MEEIVLELLLEETTFINVIGNLLSHLLELLKPHITFNHSLPLTPHSMLTLFKLIGLRSFKLTDVQADNVLLLSLLIQLLNIVNHSIVLPQVQFNKELFG